MERIIKAIEEKLEKQECTIFVQEHEIKELKCMLEKAEAIIKEQEHLISDLKGENNETLRTHE